MQDHSVLEANKISDFQIKLSN